MHPAGPALHRIVAEGQPLLISLMLFLQFVKVSPASLHLRKWHGKLLLIQGSLFILTALLTAGVSSPTLRLLIECAMLCLICPTAAAAGVITDRLGGNLTETMTYIVLINALACLLIPFMVPLVRPDASFSFFHSFLRLIVRVFSILLLPCAAAWGIRFLLPALQRRLEPLAPAAFYIWGVCLTFAMILATRALLLSGIPAGTGLLIGAVSLGCCLFQFALGRRLGRPYGSAESITAGQSLGQKNTGFLIWLGYSFLTPVTSVAGGFYAIWHNLVNSWELYRKEREG